MMVELKQRVITAVFLTILVLTVILKAEVWAFLVLITFGVGISAWEWTGFGKITAIFNKLLFLTILAVVISTCLYYQINLLYFGMLLWIVASFILPFFPEKTQILTNHRLIILSGIIILAVFWQALYFWHDQRITLILLLLIVAAADIGAYFAGKKFGKTKLAIKISPKKTVEGAIGGLILALLIGFGFLYLTNQWQASDILLISLVVIFSIVGDLTISCYKRIAKLKDSGKILPGHGGILDRIDGLLAATPIFAVLWQTLH